MPNLVSTIIDIVITNSFVSVILFLALLSGTFIFQLVSAQEQIRLEGLTDKGTFKIQLFWTSNEVGSPNVFEVRFIDPATGNEIEHVKYDISIYNQGKLEIERSDQISTFQEFYFEDVGSYEVRIDDVEDLGERVAIPIQVTAEFGTSMFVLILAGTGVGMLVVWRNSNNLFRRTIN
ncbi:MAG TPA: hypothetical protein VHF28_04680 [Nitrososphaera sp.]|nr:hypothetical protein [Nitrososphaera sp.]